MMREIRHDDFRGLMELYTQLHDNPLPSETDSLLSLWERIIDDNNYHIIVAEEDGKIVSSCTCVVIPNLTRAQRPYALVENVITDRAYRGRGLASACLDYAKQLAAGAGCYKIMLLTGAKDERTLDFYLRAGYNDKDKTAFIQWL